MAALLATATAAAPALAHQPSTVRLVLEAAPGSGPVDLAATGKGDLKIQLRLTNYDPTYDVLVRFPACHYDAVSEGVVMKNLEGLLRGEIGTAEAVLGNAVMDPAWSICVESGKPRGIFLLARGASVDIKASVDFRALGNQHVWLLGEMFAFDPENRGQEEVGFEDLLARKRIDQRTLEELLRRLAPAGEIPFDLYANVARDDKGIRYRLASYAELYLKGQPTEEDGGGHQTTEYVDGALPVDLEDFQTFKPALPRDPVYDPNHESVRLVPTDSKGPQPGDCDCREPSRNDCVTYQCDPNERAAGAVQELGPRGGTTYTVTGRYSAKWTDHTLHPAWGWRALAWWNSPSGWVVLAEDWVKWDGSYSLTFSRSGYTGQHLRMQFRAYNRYYEPMDEDDNKFRWINPDRFGISSSHNEGHWYADTDGGTANGLGEVYFRAYELWSGLYWRGGINPLRDNPIKLYYPNTEYDCGDGSGVPWSCASTGGTIWLIASHGLQRDVVQHEFGHQVNNEFHLNRRPAGAGGAHTITVCYNQGLALREGYANFMPCWVQANRSSQPASDVCGFNIEAPGSSFCKTPGNNNEGWVGATFWDLHDSRADGNDILWFNHEGAAHSIYLSDPPSADGVSLGMDDYRDNYRNAASDGHETYIDDIFEQNDTD
ncbi:MAG TPA: hypothetical protein VEC57_15615 [Candidatus Limnocylindrales bacterium]|nr:hypothetical protein [Candidatus Limnocylindrales bacterium]